MNTILLQPTDVLFFRDGRPMGGASSGHGAAWPLPSVVNHAFHAALHRAGDVFQGVHPHRRGRSGIYEETRDRRFGSLVSAGPFPVSTENGHDWFFSRPLDADDSAQAFLHPFKNQTGSTSSLEKPCQYAVVSSRPPTKDTLKSWWNGAAWSVYLGMTSTSNATIFLNDTDFADTEHRYGIGINAESGSVEEGLFYSAHYLRLREGWKLGVFAEAPDKGASHPKYGNDLIGILLNGNGCEICTGGQQRVCTATIDRNGPQRLPLPIGKSSGFERGGKWLVKWVLLSPAIYPKIEEGTSKRGTKRKPHAGGWLPTWICPETGKVLLQTISTDERKRRRGLNASGKGCESTPNIDGYLVAAIVAKPIPVTGYALANIADPDRLEGGTKPTHLAVPAGSVYYFECGSESEAQKLAAALNWHGSDPTHSTITNRRSTLMGEKGFGIGVCGTWQFHESPAKS